MVWYTAKCTGLAEDILIHPTHLSIGTCFLEDPGKKEQMGEKVSLVFIPCHVCSTASAKSVAVSGLQSVTFIRPEFFKRPQ